MGALRLLLAGLILASPGPARLHACTTAVISGKATPDGRPVLWKNRDTSSRPNAVSLLTGGQYDVLAVVSPGSISSIWMGVNSAGLCIENSLSKDLGFPESSKGLGNGSFMFKALQTCATVAEVKALLEQTDQSGRTTTANLGVIDAHGGAALFEAARKSHVMFDANDPVVAPKGFIVRSNFSLTGQKMTCPPPAELLKGLYAGERYLRADTLLSAADAAELDARYILRNVSHDMADADGSPFSGTINGPAGTLPGFIPTRSTISRTTTVSYAVFQGVKPGEDPLLTTMWVGMGDPKFTVAVPCWVGAGEVSSELSGNKNSPLCTASSSLRGKFYSAAADGIATDHLEDIWSEFSSFEDAAWQRVTAGLEQWRTRGVDRASMRAIHISTSEQALATVSHQFQRAPSGGATTTPAQ